MRHTPLLRTATVAAIAVAVLAISGCSWFRKNSAYALPAESRPLEVPPDLDRPTGAAATTDAPPAAVSRSQVGVPAAALGFAVAGARDAVYQRVGQALDGHQGVCIASRAELLGSYDVSFQGSNFLIRVVQQNEATSYVSAVDPRGVTPEGPAAGMLIDHLRGVLGGN